MQRAGYEFLARPSFSGNENCRVGGGNFGNPIKNGLQCCRGTDDFLKHRSPVDFISQRQIFFVELVLQTPDLFERFLQGCSVSMLFGDIHGCAKQLDKLACLVEQWIAHSPEVLHCSFRKKNSIRDVKVLFLMNCFLQRAIKVNSVVLMNSLQRC